MSSGRKRRFGDRREGRRLRTLDPYNELTPFIMKVKSESSNYFSDSIEITEAEKYLRTKRSQGYPGMGVLHLFTAALIRTFSQYPGANRFISGQRIYARNNIEFIMTIKKELKVASSETSVKAIFEPGETIDDVYRKLGDEIDKVKNEGEATDTDAAAKALMKMPRLILKFAVWMIFVLDYFGKLPKSLLKASPFHGSVVITDLGSIGLPAIYHHLYNIGNVPLFMSIGTKRKALEKKTDGTMVERRYIDYMLTLDERICDGFYFSQALRLFKSVIRDPWVLDAPPEKVVEDIE